MADAKQPALPEAALDAARTVLRDHGLRATPQRAIVLASVMGGSEDTTAQALHARLAPYEPSLGLATVYRTLGALAAAGILDALQHGHGTCYRRCAPGHHHHMTCTGCHKVVELHECEVEPWARRAARRHGFSDVRHVVELSGTCADCRLVTGRG